MKLDTKQEVENYLKFKCREGWDAFAKTMEIKLNSNLYNSMLFVWNSAWNDGSIMTIKTMKDMASTVRLDKD